MLISIISAVVIGYFLGALPFGFLVARSKGINIFEHGSKNPGATNVKRVLGEKFGASGKRAGNLVFALDALKGAVAAGWPYAVFLCQMLKYRLRGGVVAGVNEPFETILWLWAAIAGLVGALLGHSFSCFTRFKGGKGIATGAGGFLVLMPLSIALAASLWVGVFKTSRYVSLASILAALSLPVTSFVTARLWGFPPVQIVWLSAAIGMFVTYRHRANIVRLLNGTENRFARKS
ncbi:glycerol-3-phosphate 1-O-acyltransferase PlsY [Termitidicoccus mucosus]|uniref:Glycerol-3-phosphate acyltransferase n=1 Tax=Termitidicoccus mucosus TaxID=1184151 RepID=A0A178IGF6_9BACT|nr:glycerol-3-phosphate acyltransferase [Opitutaceae bacterium TSB47]